MDNEMIERCVMALEDRFKTFIEFNSGLSFKETKVSLPDINIWKEYCMTVIKAMREPTQKMLALGPEVQCWPEVIDCIIGEE